MSVAAKTDKEELYRRLAQIRRLIAEPIDQLTKDRLTALAADLEKQLAAVDEGDADARE